MASRSDHHSQGHHHHHHHNHGGEGESLSRLRWAFALNFFFAIVELLGGIWAGSVAILADAVHDLGDSLALGLAIFLEGQAARGPSRNFTYGMKRLSLMSALLTGVVLIVGAVAIGIEAVGRLWSDDHQPHGPGMLALAALGVIVNGVAAWRLLRGRTHNERMLSWHLIEDVLGWVAVLVGALFITFAGWTWLDPILAVAISGFVAYNASRNLVQVIMAFLQRMPLGFDPNRLRSELLKIPGVQGVHDLHCWTLDGERHVLSLHAVLSEDAQMGAVKREIRQVASHFGAFHTTVETEFAAEACGENCDPA